ncbi:MAG: 2OG-Fe(II) oxygenase, partial [Gammaproteobacteria bacterium]
LEIERACPPPSGVACSIRTVVPDILFEADDVLPPMLCDYLTNLAAPRLMPSNVVDPATGIAVQNPVRSSYSMYFGPNMYDVVMAYVSNTISGLAGIPARHAEPLAMLRYTPGQEYKPHMDYLVGSGTGEQMESRGGQRVVTTFVYLNDVEQGGETDFPELKARIKPARGRAVKFYNLDVHDEPNPLTMHAGCPVLKGEKWLATFWFRQRPFTWNPDDLKPTETSR